LFIEEYKGDPRIEVSVSLYDGVGIKIWEIRGGEDKEYRGYAFPVEYVYPLSIDTTLKYVDEEHYDKHNFLNSDIVKDVYSNSIEMNCETVLNQNEALVSNNKQYRFYVQNTGNMVIKHNNRTTWSSFTANIELFDPPYHIAFSPIGEFILRDNNTYSSWHTSNPLFSLINTEKKNTLLNKYKFYLTLSDEGELFVEDQYHNLYWSNWDKRLYSNHIRFVNPILYDITSCNEHVRNKYINYIFAKPEYYEYYLIPNDPTSLVKKYYFNNLLPGELLQSKYNASLNITENEAIFHYKNSSNETISKTLESCEKDGGVKQLRLDTKGLFLDCKENNKIKTITKIPLEDISDYEDKINKNITYNHDTYYSAYNRLSIEYHNNMEHPNLMINNVLTWEPIWSYDPPVRYLNKISDTSHIEMVNGKITTDNTFTIHDRLLSTDKSDRFIYISNIFGLEFNTGLYYGITSMNLKNKNFYINDDIVIKNRNQMELKYKGEYDKIELRNSTNYLWEMYGGFKECDYIISNDENCNTLYTVNTLNVTYVSPTIKERNGVINFYNNYLHYIEYNKINEFNIFNITEYTNIKEPIYSLSLTKNGNIGLNDNQYLLHKEYFKPDEYYYMFIKNRNLILKSSTGEYKWAVNKTISNRPYDAKEIKISHSFEEGEMLYCGDYSMIILNGKLLYRDHNLKTSTEIDYVKNNSAYLFKIEVGSNNISFIDKNNKTINSIRSPIINNNSRLYCDIRTRSIAWDIGNKQIMWSYPIINSTPSTSISTSSSTPEPLKPQSRKYIWLYNRYYKQCLYMVNQRGNNIRYEKCNKSLKSFKWYVEVINGKSYLKSAINDKLCLIVDKNEILSGRCDENLNDKAIIKYIPQFKYIKYKEKCISGIDDVDDEYSEHYLTLTTCNESNLKMLWEQKDVPSTN